MPAFVEWTSPARIYTMNKKGRPCSEIRVLLRYLDGVPHLLWPKVLLLDQPRSAGGGVRLKLHLLLTLRSVRPVLFFGFPIENSRFCLCRTE